MSFLDFCQGLFTYENQNLLFLKTTGSFLTKFCMLAFRFMEMKIYKYNACHMKKMAAMPVYGKIPLQSSLITRKNWYVASGTLAHHRLFKLWPWVDLDLFFARSNFGIWAFKQKNATMMDSLEITAACDMELIDICSWISKHKYMMFPCPLPNIIDILGPAIRWAFIGLFFFLLFRLTFRTEMLCNYINNYKAFIIPPANCVCGWV